MVHEEFALEIVLVTVVTFAYMIQVGVGEGWHTWSLVCSFRSPNKYTIENL